MDKLKAFNAGIREDCHIAKIPDGHSLFMQQRNLLRPDQVP